MDELWLQPLHPMPGAVAVTFSFTGRHQFLVGGFNPTEKALPWSSVSR
jgi:hypothetical protein